ncbi:MAG: fucose isomerase, partial [Candidatus Lokiarchaeota archaeon]|nr:fucose isomerase [Candidatus Lokiarchaeota archaeon]
MSFIRTSEEKLVFGVIVGNRDVFPDHLAQQGRLEIISVLKELGYEYVVLNENDTKFGVVETYSDAKKCVELFKKHKEDISGILIILPNFGDEKAIANTIKLSGLNVPILIQASSDEIDKMGRKYRRDAFCGKISVCNVLYQHGIPFSLTDTHTCSIRSNEFKTDITKFASVCKIVKKLRNVRFGQIGTRPNAFETV